jgi:hypothetical protein
MNRARAHGSVSRDFGEGSSVSRVVVAENQIFRPESSIRLSSGNRVAAQDALTAPEAGGVAGSMKHYRHRENWMDCLVRADFAVLLLIAGSGLSHF